MQIVSMRDVSVSYPFKIKQILADTDIGLLEQDHSIISSL